jgi:hypothetical protein
MPTRTSGHITTQHQVHEAEHRRVRTERQKALDRASLARMDDDLSVRPCSFCGGERGYLGTLGTIEHYVCRNCGMQSNQEVI